MDKSTINWNCINLTRCSSKGVEIEYGKSNLKSQTLLNFFDYLYYRISTAYAKNRGSSPGITALTLIALTQSLFILITFFLYCIIIKKNIHFSKWIFVVLYFSLLILNGIRYYKLDLTIKKDKWDNEHEKLKTIKGFLVVAYIILSIGLTFGLAIYLHSLTS